MFAVLYCLLFLSRALVPIPRILDCHCCLPQTKRSDSKSLRAVTRICESIILPMVKNWTCKSVKPLIALPRSDRMGQRCQSELAKLPDPTQASPRRRRNGRIVHRFGLERKCTQNEATDICGAIQN
jgi:hypothetical protein